MTIIFVIIIVFVVYTVIGSFVISKSHESVHKEIFEARGYKATITLKECVCDDTIKPEDIKDINYLNDLADIIQYHAQSYWFMITLLCAIVLSFVAYFIGA